MTTKKELYAMNTHIWCKKKLLLKKDL